MSRLYDTTLHCDLLFRVFYVNIFFDVCYQKGTATRKLFSWRQIFLLEMY